jgi:FkbM family methyltransferase
LNREHLLPQLLLRSWPFPRGAGRLTDKFFRKLPFKNKVETVTTTDRFPITVMPNDLIGRHIYLTGEFDRSIVEILTAFSEPGDTLLDIGANIGYVSACFLKLVQGSEVVAVEPQREVLSLLTQNLAPFGRHQIYPYAISNHDGECHFEVHVENSGGGRIVFVPSGNTVTLQLRSADSLFRETSLTKVDMVKIDAEGAETDIVRSCLPHFDRLQPRCIVFEDNAGQMRQGGALREAFDVLGYRVFGVRKSLAKIALIEADATYAHDYVAISSRRQVPAAARQKYRI